jgi:hypothetical protein
VKPDAISAAVMELADALNNLRDFLTTENSPSAVRIERTFWQLLAGQDAELKTVGILIAPNGHLQIDRSRLQAAGRKTVEAVLGAADGIGAKLVAAADRALGASLVSTLQASLLRSKSLIPGRSLVGPASGSLPGLLVDIFG